MHSHPMLGHHSLDMLSLNILPLEMLLHCGTLWNHLCWCIFFSYLCGPHPGTPTSGAAGPFLQTIWSELATDMDGALAVVQTQKLWYDPFCKFAWSREVVSFLLCRIWPGSHGKGQISSCWGRRCLHHGTVREVFANLAGKTIVACPRS